MLGLPAAHGQEVGPAARVVLLDPHAGPGPILDLLEDLLHVLPNVGVYNLWTGGVVAHLGRVAHGVAHHLEAAPIDQVHDQLHLVETLEVGGFRSVAGFHQGVEAGLDQFGDAAAQHRLLAEEVGLRLLTEGGLQDAGPGAADALAVGKGHILGATGSILVDGDQTRNPGSLREDLAHDVARGLGRDHADVHFLGWDDLAEVDVEAVGEHQGVARLQVSPNGLFVQLFLGLVGDHNHDDVGGLGGLGYRHHLQPFGFRFGPRGAALV